MRKLTLTELWLILSNLVEARAAAVGALPGGAAYQAELAALRDQIGAIPGVRGGRAFASELADADATHDTFGRALDLFLEGYEVLAAHLPAEINKVVSEARAQLLPSAGVFTASYLNEAIEAQRRAPRLEALSDDLGQLPVAGLGSLQVVAARFQEGGQRLHALLEQRGDAESAPAPQHAALRQHALSLLTDMRQSLALQQRNERRLGTSPSPDLREAQLFGYLNALVQMRAKGNSGTPQEDVVLPLDPGLDA
jgi:hypothetical protein